MPATIEDHLRDLVTRIENSSLSDDEKDKIYAVICISLNSVVAPVLQQNLPPDKVRQITEHPENATVQTFIDLVEDVDKNTPFRAELDAAMHEVVAAADRTLKARNVIS